MRSTQAVSSRHIRNAHVNFSNTVNLYKDFPNLIGPKKSFKKTTRPKSRSEIPQIINNPQNGSCANEPVKKVVQYVRMTKKTTAQKPNVTAGKSPHRTPVIKFNPSAKQSPMIDGSYKMHMQQAMSGRKIKKPMPKLDK